jgi:YVTN family beta-propeller protein
VTVIDGATSAILAEVVTGRCPIALCYNPRDNKVYCADYWGSSVTVIDGASNAVLATATAGVFPWLVCYNSRENKVYCANIGYQPWFNVTVIDGATNAVITTLPLNSSAYAICYNATNSKVYCANAGNATVISGALNAVVRTIPVGSQPRDFAWNPSQNRVYVASFGDSHIAVIRDSMTTATEESEASGTLRLVCVPTVARGVLLLPTVSGGLPSVSELLDAGGRRVTSLRPGSNDVSRLPPGVYFVRQAERVTKVVLTK